MVDLEHVCKICSGKFTSGAGLFQHFLSTHRIGPSATLTCGIVGCIVRFSALKHYEYHVFHFHAQTTQLQSAAFGSGSEDTDWFKCPFPGCNFKTKNRSTLRNHRFRHHRNQTPPDASGSQPACSDAVSLERDNSVESDNIADPFGDNGPSVTAEETTSQFHQVQQQRHDLGNKFLHLYLTLNSKLHIPDRTLQYLKETYQCLLQESNTLLVNDICDNLKRLGLSSPLATACVSSAVLQSVAADVHGPGGILRSSYMRRFQYHKEFRVIRPEGHDLGLNDNNISRKFHTVSIKDSLLAFLEDDSVLEQYEQTQSRKCSAEYYEDIFDGSLYDKVATSNKSSLFLLLYSDDLELCNPIGAAKTVHKVTNIYVALANLHPWSRTKPVNLMLALTCREKDAAYFGFESVLKPIIKELKSLETDGLQLGDKNVKVQMLALLGDNLGTHSITGFSEGFSKSYYFCRFCEESRKEWKSRWYDMEEDDDGEDNGADDDDGDDDDSDESEGDDSDDDASEVDDEDHIRYQLNSFRSLDSDVFINEGNDVNFSSEDGLRKVIGSDLSNIPHIPALRTPESYDECCRILNSRSNLDSVKGVVGTCEFNKLHSFHCVGASPPCLAHDLFEGIVPADLTLALKYLCAKFKISVEMLNRRLRSFPLRGLDKHDRPPKICAKKTRISGNAVQNWVLLRFLPLVIAEDITDWSDQVWIMMLMLRCIVQIVVSPSIRKESLPYLTALIRSYIWVRSSLFPESPLRPKHHFLEHYPQLIAIYGPLMRVSTLNFESKHPFFKETLRAKKCSKNETFTLSTEHQLMMSSLRSSNLVENHPVILNEVSFEVDVAALVLKQLQNFVGESDMKSAVLCTKITFRGSVYEKGAVIVYSATSPEKVKVCKIETICVSRGVCYAAGITLCGQIVHHLGVYLLTSLRETKVVNLALLKDYSPYSIYKWMSRDILVLKHSTA